MWGTPRRARVPVEALAAAALAGQWLGVHHEPALVCRLLGSAASLSLVLGPMAMAPVARRRARTAALLAAVAIASAWHANAAITPPASDQHVVALLGGSPRSAGRVRLEGHVRSVRVRAGASTRVLVDLDPSGAADRASTWGRVALYVRHGGHDLAVGERLGFESTLRRIENFGNFAEPDWAAWNARRGVFVTAFVWSSQELERGARKADGRAGVRAALREAIGEGRSRALVAALVTGERDALEPQVVAAVRAAGLAHVLAISGLHIGMVAGVTLWAARLLLLRTRLPRAGLDIQRPAVAAGLAAMTAYAFVSTGGVSVARAMVMGAATLWAVFVGVPPRPFRALAWAALIVSTAAPAAVVEPGFQLSFAAAGAILAWVRRRPREQARERGGDGARRLLAPPVAALAVSTVAWAATAPLVAMHFHRVSWVAPTANLVAAVPVAATVLLGLAGAAVHAAAPSMAPLLFQLAAAAAAVVIAVAEGFASPSFAETAVPAPPAYLAFAVSALVVAFVAQPPRPIRAVLVAAVAVGVACSLHARYRTERLDVTFASVGQGDATVVRFPGGRIAVVDAGRPGRGRLVVAPLLRRMHVARIDYVVVSHVQSDHFGGVAYLADEFEIGELWHPGGRCESPQFQTLVDELARRGVTIVDVAAHWARDGAAPVRSGDEGWRMAALWPRTAGHCDDNDRSVVARVEFDGATVLLPGDVEAAAESALVASSDALRADVLKVPHHGSATSSTAAFLDAVRARDAVVSAGSANSYGFPRPDVLARYRAAGVRVMRTDLDGAVRVSVGGGAVRIVAAKRR